MKAFFENKIFEYEYPLHVLYGDNFSYLAHWHREVELVYVCEGRIRIGVNNTDQILEKGDFCIVGSSDIHFYDSKDMYSSIILIVFDPAFLGSENVSFGMRHFENPFINFSSFQVPDAKISEKIRDLFNEIIEEYTRKAPFYEMYIKGKLLELWTLFLRHFPSTSPDTNDKVALLPYIQTIKSSIQFLEEHYAEPITLKDMAANVNLSPYYFSRLFKKVSGTNFKEYLDTLRIDKAESMIKNRMGAIAQIAMNCGFNSIRTFNRTFKEIKGYPPSKVRQML